MKTPARTLVVAVALAAVTALPAGAAHAREADEPSQQTVVEDSTYPAPIYRGPNAAQRTLARTLAREHLVCSVDLPSQAELALIRVLAREHLAYGTTNG
jgi:hypothetical protein